MSLFKRFIDSPTALWTTTAVFALLQLTAGIVGLITLSPITACFLGIAVLISLAARDIITIIIQPYDKPSHLLD